MKHQQSKLKKPFNANKNIEHNLEHQPMKNLDNTYRENHIKKFSANKTKTPKAQRNYKTYILATIASLILLWLFTTAVFDTYDTYNNTDNEQQITQELKLPDNNNHKIELNPKNLLSNSSLTPTNQSNQPEQIQNIISEETTIKRNDNISKILNKYNIANDEITTILNNPNIIANLKKIQLDEKINLKYKKSATDKNNSLISLSYNIDKENIFSIQKVTQSAPGLNQFTTKIEKLNLIDKISFAKLNITSSLFEDAQKQNLPLDLIFQISEIFTWDIDFAQDLRPGDTVEMIYKEYFLDGSPHSTGPIIAVNFINNGKKYSAIRYEHNHKAEYFTPNGLSMRKAFIRTPVKFTRISSKFSLSRNHPILHRIRAHKGVDYAAPTGTPIKAAGDGKIIYYGRKGGYGKAAIIQHGAKYSTLYGHMSNYKSNLRVGSLVKQGEIIGYVGQTGLASGPHLHFEFRVNDAHVNPLTVALPKASGIPQNHRGNFLKISKQLFDNLKMYSNNYIATNKFE